MITDEDCYRFNDAMQEIDLLRKLNTEMEEENNKLALEIINYNLTLDKHIIDATWSIENKRLRALNAQLVEIKFSVNNLKLKIK